MTEKRLQRLREQARAMREKVTPESWKKGGLKLRGRIRPIEERMRISQTMKGVPKSLETKEKMKLAQQIHLSKLW